ncbi:hypothetical protein [Enterobacter cloacae complex sp.]|uniref:hypothetical protein n=1 Tax=Enterobacter cloacae complex sp. TaxID=2027919 RepID=UPI0020B1354E|nr:hypothetical protein [Enterobacter cloacae complex sp.]
MTAEIIDQASALEEMMREQAIAAHRIDHNAVSAEHCSECGAAHWRNWRSYRRVPERLIPPPSPDVTAA